METPHKDTRDTIIDGAGSIFAKFGYRKTTMDEIARSVHMAKSSLYYYFSNKEDIFTAVVEKESSLLLKEIFKAVELTDVPQEKLRSYVFTRTKFLRSLANFYEVMTDEYYNHYSSVEETRSKHFKDERMMIISILEEGVNKGIFMINDLMLTADAIITCLRGFEFAWATESDFSIIEKNIDYLLNLLFNGLFKR